MSHISIFFELTRLKKPIGYMLLFWPCAWGLTLAYDFETNYNLYFFYLTLFFLGSVFMRSAGCIINDIADKEFDQKVSRTKNRPIASGKISIKKAEQKNISKIDVFVLAVKPKDALEAYNEIIDLQDKPKIISLVAGIKTQKYLKSNP